MDLLAVMNEMSTKLDAIDGLQVHTGPADSIVPPAAFVSFPEDIDYTLAYSQGKDMITINVLILVGRLVDWASNEEAIAYASGSGPRSVRQALDFTGQNMYESCTDVTVTRGSFTSVSVSGIDYLGVLFTTEIDGPGD
jgi:hypothetical protein